MPLYFFYTKVQKKSKMTKNSNQGGPALSEGLKPGRGKGERKFSVFAKASLPISPRPFP